MENHTHMMQFTWDISACKHIRYAANKGAHLELLGFSDSKSGGFWL